MNISTQFSHYSDFITENSSVQLFTLILTEKLFCARINICYKFYSCVIVKFHLGGGQPKMPVLFPGVLCIAVLLCNHNNALVAYACKMNKEEEEEIHLILDLQIVPHITLDPQCHGIECV